MKASGRRGKESDAISCREEYILSRGRIRRREPSVFSRGGIKEIISQRRGKETPEAREGKKPILTTLVSEGGSREVKCLGATGE